MQFFYSREHARFLGHISSMNAPESGECEHVPPNGAPLTGIQRTCSSTSCPSVYICIVQKFEAIKRTSSYLENHSTRKDTATELNSYVYKANAAVCVGVDLL